MSGGRPCGEAAGRGRGQAGAHRKAEGAAHLGARPLGQAPAMLSSLLAEQKRVKGSVSPRCFPEVRLRKEMLFPHSQAGHGEPREQGPGRGGSRSPWSRRLRAEPPGSFPAPTCRDFRRGLCRPRHTMLSCRSHFWSHLHCK